MTASNAATRRTRPLRIGLETVAVLAMPAIIVIALRVQLMAPLDMIDPSFYTAYSQHPRDLMARYGPTNYFWVRVAFLGPAALLNRIFSPVTAFFTLRYLLMLVAAVPVYLLIRRLRSSSAALIAVVVVLGCPILLSAWGTDYPDSAAVSYLAAGMASLVMPSSRRWLWTVVAGIALTSAVHAQVSSAPLVLATVVAALVMAARADRSGALRMGMTLLAVATGVTVAFMLVAQVLFSHYEIIRPSLRAMRQVSRQTELWHTQGVHWVGRVTYLLALPVSLGAWAAATRRQRESVSQAEKTIALMVVLQFAAFFVLQFGLRQYPLEFHLYSSMLWPGASIVLALAVVRLADRAVGLVCVSAPLLVASFLTPIPSFGWWPWGVAIAFAVVGVTWAVASRPNSRAFAGGGVVVLMASVLTLEIAPLPHTSTPTTLPQGNYAETLGGSVADRIDEYRIASALPGFVGSSGAVLLEWWPQHQIDSVNEPSAQYLWEINAIGDNMPNLGEAELSTLARRRPREVLLLSRSGSEFPAALSALEQAGFRSTSRRDAVLSSGRMRLHVMLVRGRVTI